MVFSLAWCHRMPITMMKSVFVTHVSSAGTPLFNRKSWSMTPIFRTASAPSFASRQDWRASSLYWIFPTLPPGCFFYCVFLYYFYFRGNHPSCSISQAPASYQWRVWQGRKVYWNSLSGRSTSCQLQVCSWRWSRWRCPSGTWLRPCSLAPRTPCQVKSSKAPSIEPVNYSCQFWSQWGFHLEQQVIFAICWSQCLGRGKWSSFSNCHHRLLRIGFQSVFELAFAFVNDASFKTHLHVRNFPEATSARF